MLMTLLLQPSSTLRAVTMIMYTIIYYDYFNLISLKEKLRQDRIHRLSQRASQLCSMAANLYYFSSSRHLCVVHVFVWEKSHYEAPGWPWTPNLHVSASQTLTVWFFDIMSGFSLASASKHHTHGHLSPSCYLGACSISQSCQIDVRKAFFSSIQCRDIVRVFYLYPT